MRKPDAVDLAMNTVQAKIAALFAERRELEAKQQRLQRELQQQNSNNPAAVQSLQAKLDRAAERHASIARQMAELLPDAEAAYQAIREKARQRIAEALRTSISKLPEMLRYCFSLAAAIGDDVFAERLRSWRVVDPETGAVLLEDGHMAGADLAKTWMDDEEAANLFHGLSELREPCVELRRLVEQQTEAARV